MKLFNCLLFFCILQNIQSQETPLYDVPLGTAILVRLPPDEGKNAREYTLIDGVLSDEKIKRRDIWNAVKIRDKKTFLWLGIDTTASLIDLKHATSPNEAFIYNKVKRSHETALQTPMILNAVFQTSYRERKKGLTRWIPAPLRRRASSVRQLRGKSIR